MVDKNLMSIGQVSTVNPDDMLYVVQGGTTDGRVSVDQIVATGVKSVNSRTGNVEIVAGTNVSIEVNAQEQIVVNSELSVVKTPNAISPLTGDIDISVTPTLVGSAYGQLYSVPRLHREFQIDVVGGDFSSPVSTFQVDSDSWMVDPAILDNTEFKWRCRDFDVDGEMSGWSEAQSFTTLDIYVVTPVITTPTEGGGLIERGQPITSSEFQIVNATDTHAASYWTIKDSLGSVVYQTGRDTVNLTSWQPPSGVIVDGESMTVEVVYESSVGYLSEAGVRGFVGVGVGYGKYLSVAHDSTPFVTNYGIDLQSFIQLSQPAALPAGNAVGVAYSPDGVYVATVHAAAPRLTIHKRIGDLFTKLADPSSPPTGGANNAGHTPVVFSPDGAYLVVCQSTAPFINIYRRDEDVFTRLPNPVELPAGDARSCTFSPSGDYLAVAHFVSPFVTIYKRNGDTFTKLTNPNVLPAGSGLAVAFSPDNSHLVVSNGIAAPLLNVYQRDGDTFSRLPDLPNIPTSTTRPAYTPDGSHLILGVNGTERLRIYKRSGSTYTTLPNPATLPSSAVNATAIIGDGSLVAFACLSSPYLHVYEISGDTLIKLPSPTDTVGVARSVAFWPSALYPST